MSRFKNRRVLITGGASGIGKAMGRMALEKGAELIIWDINQQAIDDTVKVFQTLGPVFGYQVDVSDTEQIKAAAVRFEKGFTFLRKWKS